MALTRTVRRLLPHRIDRGLGWDNLARAMAVLAVTLVPILTLSWTSDFWELHKAVALLVCVSLGWGATLIGMIRRGKHVWQWDRLDLMILGLLIVVGLSTFFAITPRIGLFGLSGLLSQTVPVMLSLAGLAWLVRLQFRDERFQLMLWLGLGLSVAAALIFQMFQLSGVPLLDGDFPTTPFFSLISSSPIDTALLAALLGSASLLFWSQARERWQKLVIIATTSLSWLVVLFLQQPLAWAIFAFGMIAVVMMESRRGKRVQLPLIVAAVGLAALGMVLQFTNVAEQSSVPQPIDIRLDQATSSSITSEALKHRPFLGVGPNAWYDAFVQLRPTAFNEQPLWSTRFIKARAAWWEVGATLGLLGLLAWASVLAGSVWLLWRRWKQHDNPFVLTSLLIVASTIVTGFFITWSFVWLVCLWVAIGMTLTWTTREARPKPLGTGSWVFVACLLLAFVPTIWFASRVYGSQVLVSRAQADLADATSVLTIQAELEKAVKLDPNNLDAAEVLAFIHSSLALQAAQDNQAEQVGSHVQTAVQTLQAAVDRNKTNPAAFEAMNNLLNRLSILASDAETEARKNFEQLRRIEPANPIHDVGYGQTLLLTRQRLLEDPAANETVQAQAEQLLIQAQAAFNEALAKKPDYFQARLGRVQALAAAGKVEQAISELENVDATTKTMALYWRGLGSLYDQANQGDQAVAAFNQAIILEPNDPTNYLALAGYYQSKNNLTEALAALDRGLEQLPDHPTLLQAKATLSASQPSQAE